MAHCFAVAKALSLAPGAGAHGMSHSSSRLCCSSIKRPSQCFCYVPCGKGSGMSACFVEGLRVLDNPPSSAFFQWKVWRLCTLQQKQCRSGTPCRAAGNPVQIWAHASRDEVEESTIEQKNAVKFGWKAKEKSEETAAEKLVNDGLKVSRDRVLRVAKFQQESFEGDSSRRDEANESMHGRVKNAPAGASYKERRFAKSYGDSGRGGGRYSDRESSGTAAVGRERSEASGRRPSRLEKDISPSIAFALMRLMRVEEGGAYSDLLAGYGDVDEREDSMEAELMYMERTLGFRTLRLDPKSQRLVTELVAGTVRWKRYLDYLVMEFFTGLPRDLERMEPLLRLILRLGMFQMVKLRRAPHVTVNELVQLAKVAVRPGAGSMVNAILRATGSSIGRLPLPSLDGIDDDRARARVLATVHSHPVWLVRRWMQRYGEEQTVMLMEHNNARPTFGLRSNSRQVANREALVRQLDELGVRCTPSEFLDDFVRVQSGLQEVIHAGMLSTGECAVQDESAGLVVRLLDPQPGDFIVDCCAAPGGKALYAASRMQGRGSVLAIDVHEARVRTIRAAASRQGLTKMVQTQAADVRTFARASGVSADRVLLDAPCSGLGVVGKNADLRWRRTPEDLTSLATLQDDLLDAAAEMVKPGGLLVYSTCSIEPDENDSRIQAFVIRNPSFRVESAEGIVPDAMIRPGGFFSSLPHRDHIDGAFGARLRRVVG